METGYQSEYQHAAHDDTHSSERRPPEAKINSVGGARPNIATDGTTMMELNIVPKFTGLRRGEIWDPHCHRQPDSHDCQACRRRNRSRPQPPIQPILLDASMGIKLPKVRNRRRPRPASVLQPGTLPAFTDWIY